jgi:hypothetical protein
VEQKWKMKVHLKSPHEGNPFHESRFTPCVKEFGVESFPNISQYYNLIASTGIADMSGITTWINVAFLRKHKKL